MATNEKDFISTMFPLLHQPTCDPCFILNMDQMPMFFWMHDKYTLNERVAHTFNICTSKNDSARIAVAIKITASGNSLCPMVIFKGEAQLYYLLHQKNATLTPHRVILFLITTKQKRRVTSNKKNLTHWQQGLCMPCKKRHGKIILK
jgi:hypothetical protein